MNAEFVDPFYLLRLERQEEIVHVLVSWALRRIPDSRKLFHLLDLPAFPLNDHA
jgi:hypothetical protein